MGLGVGSGVGEGVGSGVGSGVGEGVGSGVGVGVVGSSVGLNGRAVRYFVNGRRGAARNADPASCGGQEAFGVHLAQSTLHARFRSYLGVGSDVGDGVGSGVGDGVGSGVGVDVGDGVGVDVGDGVGIRVGIRVVGRSVGIPVVGRAVTPRVGSSEGRNELTGLRGAWVGIALGLFVVRNGAGVVRACPVAEGTPASSATKMSSRTIGIPGVFEIVFVVLISHEHLESIGWFGYVYSKD